MAVVFETFDQILVDGVVAGNIVDVISNHAPRRAEVLAAFNVFRDSLLTRQDEELSARNTKLTEQVNTLKSDLADKTTEASTLQSYLQSANSQLATLQSSKENLEAQLATKTEEAANLTSQLNASNERLTRLIDELPFNPRVIDPDAFFARIEKDELFNLFAATEDQQLAGIAQLLATYKKNNWQIILDDPQTVGAMQYLTAIGLLDEGRAEQLLRDATRQEAYMETVE